VKKESPKAREERMRRILAALHAEYPASRCSLSYENPFQLLVATVLSAQCTDERVNKVTPELFARLRTPQDFAGADLRTIEGLIRSTGFYRNKAKALKAIGSAIADDHGGEVPGDLEKLTAIHGVGRKTANVVLGNAFAVPSLVVDTHVTRLTNRMGFTRTKDAVKIEKEMMEIVPREEWSDFAHLMIDHGRAICIARKALCTRCVVAEDCPKVGVPRK
jgi:endonuclease-3